MKIDRLLATLKSVGCLTVISIIVIYLIVSVVVWVINQPEDIPDTTFEVITNSRVYYTNNVSKQKDGSYMMNGYWDTQEGKWTYNNKKISLGPEFGNVQVFPNKQTQTK